MEQHPQQKGSADRLLDLVIYDGNHLHTNGRGFMCAGCNLVRNADILKAFFNALLGHDARDQDHSVSSTLSVRQCSHHGVHMMKAEIGWQCDLGATNQPTQCLLHHLHSDTVHCKG